MLYSASHVIITNTCNTHQHICYTHQHICNNHQYAYVLVSRTDVLVSITDVLVSIKCVGEYNICVGDYSMCWYTHQHICYTHQHICYAHISGILTNTSIFYFLIVGTTYLCYHIPKMYGTCPIIINKKIQRMFTFVVMKRKFKQ
jgi:hypothetical protein